MVFLFLVSFGQYFLQEKYKRNISMMGILILKDVLCLSVDFYFCQIKCVFKYIIHISIDFYEQKPVQAEDQ